MSKKNTSNIELCLNASIILNDLTENEASFPLMIQKENLI